MPPNSLTVRRKAPVSFSNLQSYRPLVRRSGDWSPLSTVGPSNPYPPAIHEHREVSCFADLLDCNISFASRVGHLSDFPAWNSWDENDPDCIEVNAQWLIGIAREDNIRDRAACAWIDCAEPLSTRTLNRQIVPMPNDKEQRCADRYRAFWS